MIFRATQKRIWFYVKQVSKKRTDWRIRNKSKNAKVPHTRNKRTNNLKVEVVEKLKPKLFHGYVCVYIYHLRFYRVCFSCRCIHRHRQCHFFRLVHKSNTFFVSSVSEGWKNKIKYRHQIFVAVELNCKQFQNVDIPHEFLMCLNPMILSLLFSCSLSCSYCCSILVVDVFCILYNRA